MKERIQKVIDAENATPSRFAEEIGIQRAAMSHILNGRNNPSLDVVTKILQRFPKINSNWLLFGKGEMYTGKATEVPYLFKNTSLFPDEYADDPKNCTRNESNLPQKLKEIPNTEQVMVVESPSKKVTKIMLFYSDNTFDTFIPEKEPQLK
ncbi:MAG: helix-turn-helix domain-containing protein [Tannerellaceae bacterium]|jgi:DNA-binding XRE family transcriptional regulator|nr:helix-turn-helix domain-containing protein [Tannerellaceae bacterium]